MFCRGREENIEVVGEGSEGGVVEGSEDGVGKVRYVSAAEGLSYIFICYIYDTSAVNRRMYSI